MVDVNEWGGTNYVERYVLEGAMFVVDVRQREGRCKQRGLGWGRARATQENRPTYRVSGADEVVATDLGDLGLLRLLFRLLGTCHVCLTTAWMWGMFAGDGRR